MGLKRCLEISDAFIWNQVRLAAKKNKIIQNMIMCIFRARKQYVVTEKNGSNNALLKGVGGGGIE